MTDTTTTPVPMTVVRWKCPHCSRSRSRKAATAEHIARCWRNPDVAACWTCQHYSRPESAGRADPCIPGQTCGCGDSPAECAADVDVPGDGTPVTGCPLWEMAS